MQATVTKLRTAREAETAALVKRISSLNFRAAEASGRVTKAHFADFGGVEVVLEVDWDDDEPMVCWVWINGVCLDAEDHFSAQQRNVWEAKLIADALEAA